MSASNKSWLMVGGLALLVAGVIYATRQLNVKPAPPAEIAPTTLTHETSSASQTRTHSPTILRAKPVIETEPTASPRYAPRNASVPADDLQFGQNPATSFPPLTAPPTTTFPPAVELPQTGSSVPTFRDPPAVDEQILDDEQAVDNEQDPQPDAPSDKSADAAQADAAQADAAQADTAQANMPTTYVTRSDDSFWNISKRQYAGEGRFFKALYYHNRNRILRPDQIPPGIEIETPPLAELKRLYPDLCRPGRRN